MSVVNFNQGLNDCGEISESTSGDVIEDLVFGVRHCEDKHFCPLKGTSYENEIPKKSLLKQTSIIPSTESKSTTSSCVKSISFALMTKVNFVDSFLPVKDEIWWNHSDYRNFKAFSMYIAGALPTCDISTNACRTSTEAWWSKIGHSRRGLESYTEEGLERQRKVKEFIQSVIKEQNFHKFLGGELNHALLAQFSMRRSINAQKLALETGLVDAAAANSDLFEEDRIRQDNRSLYTRRATANDTMIDNIRSFFFPSEDCEFRKSNDKIRKRHSLQPRTRASKHSAFRLPL